MADEKLTPDPSKTSTLDPSVTKHIRAKFKSLEGLSGNFTQQLLAICYLCAPADQRDALIGQLDSEDNKKIIRPLTRYLDNPDWLMSKYSPREAWVTADNAAYAIQTVLFEHITHIAKENKLEDIAALLRAGKQFADSLHQTADAYRLPILITSNSLFFGEYGQMAGFAVGVMCIVLAAVAVSSPAAIAGLASTGYVALLFAVVCFVTHFEARWSRDHAKQRLLADDRPGESHSVGDGCLATSLDKASINTQKAIGHTTFFVSHLQLVGGSNDLTDTYADRPNSAPAPIEGIV